MEHEKIAELLAEKIYYPAKTEADIAVCLLVEELAIPKQVKRYTLDDAKSYILVALSKNTPTPDMTLGNNQEGKTS